ncbi:MAG: hypothetical protein ABID64_02110 [Nitrospirota bacterium]
MKKLFSLLLGFALVLTLAGCSFDFSFGGGDDEEEVIAPEEEIVEEEEVVEEEEEVVEEEEEVVEEEEEVVEEEEEVVEEEEEPGYTGANYITITSPDPDSDYHEQPIVFEGIVSPNTKKIVVTATIQAMDMNPDALDVVDVYTLQDFKYGDANFVYRSSMEWGNLFYGTNDYEFKAYYDDGKTSSAYLTVYFSPATAEIGKPVVYLYPEKTMKVFVDVEPEGGISVSEPELADGWNVVATPDSKIYNFADRGVYPYLFWEGYAYDFVTPEEGFVVESDGVEKFFDEKLAVLGLNEVEVADFKEFWVPRLSEDPYYFITFISQEDFDKYAPLTVDPEPDSVIRVFFDYKGLDGKAEVKEQKLVTPEREGFTVVEWGGRLYR